MKFLIFSLLVTSAVFARVNTYDCYDLYGKIRQQGELHPAQAKFSLKLSRDKNGRKAIVNGKIAAMYDWGDEEAGDLFSNDDAYIGVFEDVTVNNNPKYDGDFYSYHYQYKLEASATVGAEDGMWGYLVHPKRFKKAFLAHFVFQAGDHMGGTLDLRCKLRK